MALQFTDEDKAILAGEKGNGAKMALRIVAETARLMGAPRLLPVASAHIDGALYHGDSGTLFAEKLVEGDAKVAVRSTLNVGALDLMGCSKQRLPPHERDMAKRMMRAYEKMGCEPSWTCSPYQAGHRPALGSDVAWGESNAVVFCNSVLGARTNRYGDFLDIACAIAGRALYDGRLDAREALGSTGVGQGVAIPHARIPGLTAIFALFARLPKAIEFAAVDGKPVEVATANAYIVMSQAAAKAGVKLAVVSGFRTMAEQQYLYKCYTCCCCNSCNLAAVPGTSNHQSGHALDLNTAAAGVYGWLDKHGKSYGFKRTVPSEAWHWEWWGGGPGGGGQGGGPLDQVGGGPGMAGRVGVQDGLEEGTVDSIDAAGTDPDEVTDPSAVGAAPPSTQIPTSARSNSACRTGNPLANVYHPYRLRVVSDCLTVSGIVSAVRHEPDGDDHINLMLDDAFAGLINSRNVSGEHGALVIEIIPADKPGCTPGQPPKAPSGSCACKASTSPSSRTRRSPWATRRS